MLTCASVSCYLCFVEFATDSRGSTGVGEWISFHKFASEFVGEDVALAMCRAKTVPMMQNHKIPKGVVLYARVGELQGQVALFVRSGSSSKTHHLAFSCVVLRCVRAFHVFAG